MGAILRPFPNILAPPKRFKPSGLQRIDWTHPLACGLVSYWIDVGNGIHIDLVSGHQTMVNTVFDASAVHGTVKATAYGQGLDFTNLVEMYDPTPAIIQSVASPYSYAMGWAQITVPAASIGNSQWFCLSDNVAPNVAVGFVSTASATTVDGFYNNTDISASVTPAANSFHVSLLSATGATTMNWWDNGVLVTQNTTVSTSFTFANTGHWTFGQSGVSAPLNAVICFGAFWNRALTINNARQLYTDPYCFLIPAGEAELPSIFAGVTAFSMTAATGSYALAQEQKLLARAAINYPQAASFALTDEAEQLEKGSFYKPQAGFYLLNSAALTAFDPSNAGTTIALSNANLTATGITSTANGIVRSVAKESSGKFYCEFTCTSASANATGVGICDASEILNGVSLGADLNGLGFENSNGTTGHVYINNNPTAIQGYNNGDNVGMAVDFDDKTIWFRTNGGNWNNSGTANPATNAGGIDISSLNAGSYYAAVNTFAVGDAITANFGATAYSYTIPAGFFNWGAFTGGNEKLTKASKVTAQSTPYALTDEQLTTLRTATAKLQTDFYTVTGGSPTLTFTIITAFSITLSTGSYALTDEAETLKAGRLDVAQTALYALTDEQLQTRKGYRANLQTNFYALTVEQEKVLGARKLFPQETPFAFAGGLFSLTTTTSLQIILSTGNYALTDEAETLLRKAKLSLLTTPYALNFDGQLPADLLLHMDGTNGSTTFTDATGRHTAVVTLGTVTIDTSKSAFGGASAKFANNSQLAFQNNRADFQFGTGDYTIDGWWYFTDLTNTPIFLEWDSAGAINNFTYWVLANGAIQFFINDDPIGGNVLTTAAGVFTINAFHHVAFTRASGVFYIFVDGVSAGSAADTNNYDLPSNDPYIGPIFGAVGSWVDEFRVINGVAAWTSNFMVPSQAYTELGDETLLKGSKQFPWMTPYTVNLIGVNDARSFNGSSDYIDLGSSVMLPSAAWTVSAWVNATALTNAYNTVLMRINAGNSLWIILWVKSNGKLAIYLTLSGGGVAYDGTGSYTLSLSTWYHVAFTYDSVAGLIGYVGGTSDNTAAPRGTLTATGDTQIGANPIGAGADNWSGSIADIAQWNVALTPTQITQLASGTRADQVGSNANLVSYQPITGASPEPDKSGNGNNGVLNGTTVVAGPPGLAPYGGRSVGVETLRKASTLLPQVTPYMLNNLDSIARSFNGTSDLIDCGTAVNSPAAITFSAWVYFTSFTNADGGYIAVMSRQNGGVYQLLVKSNGKLAIYVLASGGLVSYDGSGSNTLSLDTWYHLAFTYDSTNGIIGYLNGALDATAAANGILSAVTGNFYISNDFGVPGRYLPGSIADIAQWNVALTPTQLGNLAAGRRASTVASANLDLYLPILGQSPEPDKSGNSNNGTLTGTAVVSGPPALDLFGGGTIAGYETLLWDHTDKTQSVPYHLNTEPTDLARAFNGTTDYIDLGTHTWDPTTSATFSSWVYIVALPASYAGLFSTNNPNPAIFYLRNSGQLAFYIFNNWGNAANDPLLGGPTLSTGQWYHFAWTVVSGGNLNFYLNGTLNGSFAVGTGGGGSSIEQALLGQDITSGSLYPFNGYMSDIALWNTVLTGTQIFNLAAGQRANTIATPNLIMNLPITGASPEPDVSGPQGRYGTLNGTSVVAGPPTLQSYTPIEGYETLLKDSVDYPQAGFYNLKVESITLSTLVPFLMLLGTGNYLLTDESLVLIKTSRLGAQTGTYSLNDEQLRTLKGSQLKDTAGTYSIIGEQLTLKAARKANLQATFYNLAGEAVTLIAPAGAFAMNIGTGAYVLTDETLTLLKGSHLYPQRVPYNITEFNTIIPQNFFLFPNTMYYALSDEQETLLKTATNNIQVGTYNLTDEQLATLRGSAVLNTTGFYTSTGERLTLKATRLDHPQTGLYSLLEPSLSLTIPGQFFMTVTSGSYAVTDESETLLKTSQVAIRPISYAFTVEPEQALRAAATFPQTTVYALTPEQLGELKKSTIKTQAVTYSFTVENDQLLRGRTISVPSGSYTLTGKQIIDAITAITMNLKPGNYALTVEALKVTTTAPTVSVIFTASPVLIGRDAVPNLLGKELTPELEGEV